MDAVDDSDLLIITEEEAGQRLDKILAMRFQEFKSRSYFQYLIEQQKVFLNGETVKKRALPKAGDQIEIQFICLPELSLTPEPIPLEIIFEDDAMLVVNKPAGMVVHPAVGNWSGTFVNALLYHCKGIESMLTFEENKPSSVRPGIVHRLDKDTSGLLLAAKTPEAHEKLSKLFSSRKIYKEYLAICVGNPGNLTINRPIGRNPNCYKQMTVVQKGGKEAITHCKTLAYNGKLSFVSIELQTGRTHQIRVHLQSQGAPVLGDPVYGNLKINQSYNLQTQMLHAHCLRLSHPLTQELLEFKAPLPPKMEEFYNNIFL